MLLDEPQASRLAQRLCKPPSGGSRTWKTSPIPRGLIRPSPPARCSRRPTASTGSPPGTPCRWPKASTRTATSPTCGPTRPRWPRVAVEAARQSGRLAIRRRNTCPPAPRVYQTKVKNAQEAHEAIRPAGHPFEFPESLRGRLSPDEFKLYDLVWKRTVASQMADARGHRVTVTIEAEGAVFTGGGQDDRVCGLSAGLRRRLRRSGGRSGRSRRRACRRLRSGEPIHCRLAPSRRATRRSRPTGTAKPSLTRALEEMGIGRPSTYASIIDTILARDYVFKLKRGNVLVPTWTRVRRGAIVGGPPARPGRLPVHRRDGGRTGRDQPRRNGPSRLFADVLLRQRAPGAEATAGKQADGDRRPGRLPHLAGHPARRRRNRGGDLRPRRPLRAVSGTGRAAARACPTACRPTN